MTSPRPSPSSPGPTAAGSTRKSCASTAASPDRHVFPRAVRPRPTQRRFSMKQVILVTGASSGFGALSARALARAGHTVYASMRATTGRNAPQVKAVEDYARELGVNLRTVELDVQSEESAQAAVTQIVDAHGRIDVVVHNAGHM